MRHRISLNLLGLIRWAHTAQVGRNCKMVLAELQEVRTVKRPVVREAVKEQHERAFARPNVVQPDTLARRIPVLQIDLSRCRLARDGAQSDREFHSERCGQLDEASPFAQPERHELLPMSVRTDPCHCHEPAAKPGQATASSFGCKASA
jgi:hypothetical protein